MASILLKMPYWLINNIKSILFIIYSLINKYNFNSIEK